MALEQASYYCIHCRHQRIFARQGTNHVLHLLASVFLCGLWLPVWILIAIGDGGSAYRCQSCGFAEVPKYLANPNLRALEAQQQQYNLTASKRLKSQQNYEPKEQSGFIKWLANLNTTWKIATIVTSILLAGGVLIFFSAVNKSKKNFESSSVTPVTSPTPTIIESIKNVVRKGNEVSFNYTAYLEGFDTISDVIADCRTQLHRITYRAITKDGVVVSEYDKEPNLIRKPSEDMKRAIQKACEQSKKK